MALTRCPGCQLPLTDAEAGLGSCPVCAAALTPIKVSPPSTTLPPPAVSGLSPVWAVVGGVVICGILAALWLVLRQGDRPAEPSVKPPVAQGKKDKHLVITPAKKSPEKDVADNTDNILPYPMAASTQQETLKPPGETVVGPEILDLPLLAKEEPAPLPKEKVDPVVKPPQVPKVIVKKADPKLPGAKGQRLAALPLLANDAIKFDGDLADWHGVPEVVLHPVVRGRATKKVIVTPKMQKGHVAYCPKGLLVAVDVEDTSGALENHAVPGKGIWPFWDNDALEVYIDTLNAHAARRGERTAHQFFGFPLGSAGDAGIGGYESRIFKNAAGRDDWTIVPHASTGPQGMLRAGKKTPLGWTMELLIPAAALRNGDVRPGTFLGMELQIDTGTNLFYFWACQDPHVHVSMRPDRWGEVMLGGSDAVVEFLDAKGQPTKSFLPGQPLTVRIRDLDANADPAKKDKIRVSLRSRSGDVKGMILVETEMDSGTFVGVFPTALGPVRAETVLEVLAQDELVLEYLDEVRGNGDLAVPVRVTCLGKK